MKLKITILLLFLFTLMVSLPQSVQAVTKTSDDLQVTYDDPMFPSSIIWYPSLSVTRSLEIKNTGSFAHTLYFNTQNTSQTGNLAEILLFNIQNGSTNVYGVGDTKSMKNFWDTGQLNVKDINAGAAEIYDFTVKMPYSAGNGYQNKSAKFDLITGFIGTTSTVTITSTGGGTGGGAAICSDAKPGGAPVLLTALSSGPNSVTLTWSKAPDPVTYYLVAYGTTPGNYIYGNPDVGNTTGYTVSGLSGGTTYYFVVRAGNGCMPGPFSNELSNTPAGVLIAGPATGFTEGVLGESTAIEETETSSAGEIQGIQTETCKQCIWLRFIIMETVGLSVFYLLFRNSYRKKVLIAGFIFPIVIHILFVYYNCKWEWDWFVFPKTPDFFCRFFILLNGLIYVILSSLYKKLGKT